MSPIYVVAIFTGGTIYTKRSSIETWALRNFIEGCTETPDRVVMFEMNLDGPYDAVLVHQTAYAKALNGDFVAIEERAAIPQPAPEPKPNFNVISDKAMDLITYGEYPVPSEHECFAVEAAYQFGFETVDDDAVWIMCRAQHISALLDHVAKHAKETPCAS